MNIVVRDSSERTGIATPPSLFDNGPPDVPGALAGQIGVGKRVEVPFGRGTKTTSGFCVRVTDVAPTTSFEIKPVVRVLDADALVDDHLMKLTRWMADYYLCGWGQVLHAVVPAGAREKAGTRVAAFVEPVAKDALPNPLPTVTPQQKVALDALKQAGHALEILQLARRAKCSAGVVHGLAKKGLVRKFSERIETSNQEAGGRRRHNALGRHRPQPRSGARLDPGPERAQRRRVQPVSAPRHHRQRQD